MLVCLFGANYVIAVIKWPLTQATCQLSGHQPDRQRQLWHQSSGQLSPSRRSSSSCSNTGTNRFAAVRIEPVRLGTNQVLGWRVTDDPAAIADMRADAH